MIRQVPAFYAGNLAEVVDLRLSRRSILDEDENFDILSARYERSSIRCLTT